MNWQKIYNHLVDKGLSRDPPLMGEWHHIHPKCLGGLDEFDNLVKFTYREHLIAHLLLARLNPSSVGLVCAAALMTKSGNSRHYEYARTAWSQLQSSRMQGIGNTRYGVSPSRETRFKISLANKGRIVSKETRAKLSLANYGKKHATYKLSEEVKKAISIRTSGKNNPRYGITLSKEIRRKLVNLVQGEFHHVKV